MALKYIVKCDECKRSIGETDSLQESAAGGTCFNCQMNRAKLRSPGFDWGTTPTRKEWEALLAQRDALLEALEWIIEGVDVGERSVHSPKIAHGVAEARAAIAAAREATEEAS